MKVRDALLRIALLARLLARDLLRRRLTLLLLFAVPALFQGIVLSTTKSRPVAVMLGPLVEPGAFEPSSAEARYFENLLDDGLRSFDERRLSLVVLGGTAVCFLSSFLAFYLVHRRTDADRRLVGAGYRPSEVLLAKVLVVAALVVLLAAYETAIAAPHLEAEHPVRVAAAFALGGLVYGCAGLAVGALVRHELEGVFVIVLLANVDPGWLQNPAYYEGSERRWLVEALPGYGSSQLAILGAFTDTVPLAEVGRAFAWAGALLAAALGAFWLRIRPASPRALSERAYYLRVLSAVYLAWLASYYAVGALASELPVHDLTTRLDRGLPFVPEAVWVYELCYLAPFLALFAVRDFHRFNVALLAVALSCAVAYACYFALPVAFEHPTLGDSASERVLALEYAAEFSPGANNLPSLHVTFAWLFFFAARRGRWGRLGDALGAVLAAGITVSTVLVRQHLVVDAVAGVGLALAAQFVAPRAYRRLAPAGLAPREALRALLRPRRAARGKLPDHDERRLAGRDDRSR